MLPGFLFILIRILFLTYSCVCNEEFCHKSSCPTSRNLQIDRFLLYDVNPPEGFNLRRDVFMRFAILAHKLKNSQQRTLNTFKLVLPPWSHLYHWEYSQEPEYVPWGLYFDLDSLKRFAPVLEMHEFFQALNKSYSVSIDQVYVLQHFKDMFETGNFEDRMKVEECQQMHNINYFYYKNITARNVKCLSYHGAATKLSQLLQETTARTVMFHHAEVALHEFFGDGLYWKCRRSMRFSKELKKVAEDFRRNFLNSTDDLDGTGLPPLWEDEKLRRNASGGPYLAVHVRRRDFLKGRAHQVPSIESTAKQIVDTLRRLKLDTVFVATDATSDEYNRLVKELPFKVLKFVPSKEFKSKFKDGGAAIVEQIICAHARYFIGTFESTFSFRIQEEREIMGFPVAATFNCFCKDEGDCQKPSIWKIVH